MIFSLNAAQLEKLLRLHRICKRGNPPFPDFLEWIADRLVAKADDPQVDFVQHLRRQARDIREAMSDTGS